MSYNFDEIIDRKNTDSLNYDGWREYIFNNRTDITFPFKDEEYVRMWVADMDFSTPPEILNAIKRRLDAKILGYTKVYDRSYYDSYLSWCQRQYQWDCNVDDIVFAPGVVPALKRLIPLVINENEKVLITTPSYAPFKGASDYNHRDVIYSRLINQNEYYHLDFDDIEAKLSDPKLNIKLFIFCHPHNPTGRVWTEDELIKIGELCEQYDVWLISDEIHCDLLRNGKKHTPLAKLFPNMDKLITCMAPSKTFNLAGNMMSHIFIKDKSLKSKWLNLYNDYLSPLSLVASKAAFSECDQWLKELNHYLDDNFNFVAEFIKRELPKIQFNIPESTYLAWINVSPYLSDSIDKDQLSYYFATHAPVLVEGGNMFVDNGEGYIRVNIASPRSVIEKGLNYIRDVLLNPSH